MSDAVWVALIASIPATVGAILSMSNNRKARTIIQKADVIHNLTNSTLTKVKAELALANEKITKLEQLLTERGNS